MKKAFLITSILLSALTASLAQTLTADNIVGVWLTNNKELKIEIFKSGSSYSAKILWAKEMFEPDGKTIRKDLKNPNEKLRSRPVQGIVHITGLVYQDGGYVDGKLYSWQDGNNYSIKGKLININKLETRGFKGVPMMGKTFKWDRVN